MNIRREVAAATAVVNYDLIQGEVNARLPEARVLTGVSLVGSTAVGDCVMEVMVGSKSIGQFENSSTGLAFDMQKDLKKMDEYIPANQLIQAFVRDAANGNPVVVYMEFAKPKARTSTFKRRSGSSKRSSYGKSAGGFY